MFNIVIKDPASESGENSVEVCSASVDRETRKVSFENQGRTMESCVSIDNVIRFEESKAEVLKAQAFLPLCAHLTEAIRILKDTGMTDIEINARFGYENDDFFQGMLDAVAKSDAYELEPYIRET